MPPKQELQILSNLPLHYFAALGNTDDLYQCLTKTQLNPFEADTLNYWTPAHWAASSDQYNCLHILSQHRAVDVPSERSLTTPLHVASELGYSDSVRVLLSCGVRVNVQDSTGDTPLHKTARHGHMDCMRLLIDAGACADTRNFYGRTSSELAALHGHFQFSAIVNQAVSIQKRENQCPPNGQIPPSTSAPPPGGILACKRSRGGPATVDALDGDLSDKRLRFSDPVLQIASDMVGQGSQRQWRDDIQSSILENAAEIRMADVYEEYYLTRYANINCDKN